jgi:hypothetical protein
MLFTALAEVLGQLMLLKQFPAGLQGLQAAWVEVGVEVLGVVGVVLLGGADPAIALNVMWQLSP